MPAMSEEAAVRREVVPMNLLIVDDEQSIRETCATVSEQCGMKAVAVATAEEALEVLEHSPIDILLTDLKLRQTNGVELLKQVHDVHPEVAVVVLTQYGTIESALEVTRIGAVDYVTKPFRVEELQEMDEGMGSRKQTILVVSDDAALCTAARREFEARIAGVRVASVTSVAAAKRILEEHAPAVILFEEASIAPEGDGLRGIAPRLDAAVTSLAVYAPVVVIGTAEQRVELSALIDAGAADYVMRDGECLPSALLLIQSRLRQAQKAADNVPDRFEEAEQDFGEVLRHELNNPLTGILGNAELLLAEVHRKKDGKLPHGEEQRLETIAALAVRLRETVRRLSQEWEARQHPVH